MLHGREDSRETRLLGRDLLEVWVRSLFLQSAWNARGMQHVGFCFAMLPVLRRLDLRGRQARAFLERHLAFFNTNPVLSSYAIGAAAAAETRGPDAQEPSPEEIKSALAGPLGMAGDSLMWSSVRPLAAFVGLALALVGRPIAGVVALLVVYNAFHLVFRWRGLVAGVSKGTAAVDEVLGPGFRRLVTLARGAGAFAAGVVVAIAVVGSEIALPAALVVGGSFFVLGLAACAARVPATLVGIGGAVGGLLFVALR